MNNIDLINEWHKEYPGTLISSESKLKDLILIMTVDKSVTHDQKTDFWRSQCYYETTFDGTKPETYWKFQETPEYEYGAIRYVEMLVG